MLAEFWSLAHFRVMVNAFYSVYTLHIAVKSYDFVISVGDTVQQCRL